MSVERPIPIRFFRLESGREPVRDWLKNLGQADRKTVGADIKTLQYGWPIGMPLARKMAENLADFEEAQARTLSASGEGGFVAAGDIVGAESAVSPAPISPWVLGGGALALVLVALVFARKR